MSYIFYAVIIILIIGALAPLVNIIAVLLGSPSLIPQASDADVAVMAKLGQMGDFFGGHTAAFSGLLSAALIVHFSLQQLKVAKQTADLTSIAKIYDHYNEEYGVNTQGRTKILSGVARGHRRWAIRESFSIIDPDGALEAQRKKQVNADFEKLVALSGEQHSPPDYPLIAELCGSLLLDKRLDRRKRLALWTLYEALRRDAATFDEPSSQGPLTLASEIGKIHRRFLNGFSW